MKRLINILGCLLLIGGLMACAGVPPLPPADIGPRTHIVHVTSNGWHTAIVVSRPDLVATGLLPEADDFPDVAFMEFGWGDQEYYPANDKTTGMALRAALTPSPSVMHMAGLERGPELTYPDDEIVLLALTTGEFGNLIGSIAGSFRRSGDNRVEPISRGLYPNSNFYPAQGAFHLFNTCNTWTAIRLREAGMDLSPAGIVTADDLMSRLRVAVLAR